MVKKLLCAAAAILLACSLTIPALAEEAGTVYDETDALMSDALTELGTVDLPDFSAQTGIDLRVDVLLEAGGFADLYDAAAAIYEHYDYGYGEEKNGISLTIKLSEDENGYTLDDWVIYINGSTTLLPAEVVTSVYTGGLVDYLNSAAWSGDLAEDTVVLAQAVQTFLNSVKQFYASNTDLSGSSISSAQQNSILSQENADGYSHVFDTAGLMMEEERAALEEKAREISSEHDFGVYMVTVDDFRDYSDQSVFQAALNIYNSSGFGMGDDRDGVLLLLSMDDRDFTLLTNGTFGNYAFNDAGREKMTEFFLDDFGDNAWYAGFTDYANWADKYLVKAEEGTPYSGSNVPYNLQEKLILIALLVLLILLVPLLPAALVTYILNRKMKSVAKGTEASQYVSQDLSLFNRYDAYMTTTETRVYDPVKKSSSSGLSHSHSGSASGTSGKF